MNCAICGAIGGRDWRKKKFIHSTVSLTGGGRRHFYLCPSHQSFRDFERATLSPPPGGATPNQTAPAGGGAFPRKDQSP
jgi:hypothetical protein